MIATRSYRKSKKMSADEILEAFAEKELILQLGGNATTGKGLCSIVFASLEKSDEK